MTTEIIQSVYCPLCRTNIRLEEGAVVPASEGVPRRAADPERFGVAAERIYGRVGENRHAYRGFGTGNARGAARVGPDADHRGGREKIRR